MSVVERMSQIQSAFLEAKEFALGSKQNKHLSDYLSAKSGDFTSVSFEGASMGLALNSYNKTGDFSGWNWFIEKYSAAHDSQIYVGLGWAIAEVDIDPMPLVNTLSPAYGWRVIDGFGYYHGILRRRLAVKQQLIPDTVSNSFISAYDQGLGRSFWYNAKGEINRVLETMLLFPKDRNPAFWRGLGVALTYVGGTPHETIKTVKEAASQSNLSNLKYGALMALVSRKKAGTISVDSNATVLYLVPNFNDIIGRLEQLEKEENANYLTTIKAIEDFL
jgi:hypothetical protein